MFRALFIKHWVQLRAVRWVGFALGLILPFFLWTGASAAQRGWLPVPLNDYSLSILFGEATPVLSVLMWWGLSVLFAAESFAGDRANGTERFLLERPVPRGRVWRARMAASLGSILLIVLGHSAYLLGLFTIVDDNTFATGHSNILTACAVGLALALLGTLGGMAAGEMLRTPLQAVMVGALLAALPVGVTLLLSAVFQMVLLEDGIHLAVFVTPILPLALVLMSYRAGCRGEPAGRGRLLRGATVLVIGLLATSVLFAAATPFVLRARAGGGWPEGGTPVNGRMVLTHGNWLWGGWAIDAVAGEKIRFLAPPVEAASWNDAGTRLAVVHGRGTLGSVGARRLDILDAEGKLLHSHPFVFHQGEIAAFVRWVGERILVRDFRGAGSSRLRILDPEDGTIGEIPVDSDNWGLFGPTDDGSLYIHRLVGTEPRRYELQRLNLDAGQIGESVFLEQGDAPTYTRRTLSPSGRFLTGNYWDSEARVRHSWVVDLTNGERTDYPGGGIAGWLSGDRLVRSEPLSEGGERLIVQHGVAEILGSRTFEAAIAVAIAPDRERLLVTRSSDPERQPTWQMYQGRMVRGTRVDGLWIWDLTAWTDLTALYAGLPDEQESIETWITWGGSGTLLATTGLGVATAAAEPGARWTRLIGSWK